jgi:hypothetical protein
MPVVLPAGDAQDLALLRADDPFPPGPVDPFEALLARHGADLALLGEVSRADGFVFVEWGLLGSRELPTRWVGDADDGIEYLADLMAQRYASRVSEAGGAVALRVDAVGDALAYARTLAHLRRFVLIERLSLERVEGGTLHFTLVTGAEGEKLGRLIALADFLEPDLAAAGPAPLLRFRYGEGPVPPLTEATGARGTADAGDATRRAGTDADAPR